jgi:hypothetical protein
MHSIDRFKVGQRIQGYRANGVEWEVKEVQHDYYVLIRVDSIRAEFLSPPVMKMLMKKNERHYIESDKLYPTRTC